MVDRAGTLFLWSEQPSAYYINITKKIKWVFLKTKVFAYFRNCNHLPLYFMPYCSNKQKNKHCSVINSGTLCYCFIPALLVFTPSSITLLHPSPPLLASVVMRPYGCSEQSAASLRPCATPPLLSGLPPLQIG